MYGNVHSVAFNPIRDTLFEGNQTAYDLWGMANGIATSMMMPVIGNAPQVGHLSNEISSGDSSVANIADDVITDVADNVDDAPVALKNSKYSELEIKNIINNLKCDGFKNNPLRQAYENEIADLKAYGEELLASGISEKQVAQTLNQARRDLGIKYKNATPQPLRDYIYEINIGRYGDKLGPTYDWLVSEKGATNMGIINSSSRPNSNIDKLLYGFEEWLRRQ